MAVDGQLLNPLELAREAYSLGESAVDLGLMVGMFVSLGLVGINSNPITRFASRKLVEAYFPKETPDNVVPIYDAVSSLQPVVGLHYDQLEPARALG
jgi:hypothetical protein